jgi:hypothetical protein
MADAHDAAKLVEELFGPHFDGAPDLAVRHPRDARRYRRDA